MMALTDTHWFAIQAHPRAEAAAEFNLRSLSIETLLPLARRPVRHATRAARMAVRPLFPGFFSGAFAQKIRCVRSLTAAASCVCLVRATAQFQWRIRLLQAFVHAWRPTAASSWRNIGSVPAIVCALHPARWRVGPVSLSANLPIRNAS
jgi:hypothetical protein